MLILFFNIIIINSLFSFFSKNPIYSLLYLIANYSIVGLIFLLNSYIFLSLIFMLIYVGAVSILLLFTLMLLNIKIIYYNNFNKKIMTNIFYFVLFVQVFSFVYIWKNCDMLNVENSYFFDWFLIVVLKNDLKNLAFDMYLKNSTLVFIVSLLILMSLIASVNIVNSLKNSKSQEAYFQLKNYTKNFIN